MTSEVQQPPKYFITHLTAKCREPNSVRQEELPAFSIEFRATRGGLSGKRAYFDVDSIDVQIEGVQIPEKIIAVAKQLPPGDGGWFDEDGKRIIPY
jgi:hypothetical protein